MRIDDTDHTDDLSEVWNVFARSVVGCCGTCSTEIRYQNSVSNEMEGLLCLLLILGYCCLVKHAYVLVWFLWQPIRFIFTLQHVRGTVFVCIEFTIRMLTPIHFICMGFSIPYYNPYS